MAEVCRNRNRGYVCVVMPTEASGRIVSGLNSVHSTTRQLQVILAPASAAQDPLFFTPLYRYGVQVLANESGSNSADRLTMGRWIELAKADVGLLKVWITSCDEKHLSACAPVPWDNQQPTFTFRVIDVKRRCVIDDPPTSCIFFALSYVWGHPKLAKHLKLTRESARWLYEKGALSEENSDVPKTIKDAIGLVDQLGGMYLWVDALCIYQDDEDDKKSQIPVMDKIYSSAKCTIVAGSGSDAWAGLPGAGLNPRPRSAKQYSATVKGIPLITTQKHYKAWRESAVWDKRGWTLQEKVLSKRLMVFTDDQVFFQCQEALWYEDTILENFDRNISFTHRDIDHYTQGSPFTSYESMMVHFLHRSFGYQEDVLNAFLGLENYLRDLPSRTENKVTLSAGFYWGLPESMFDVAITWTFPYHYPERRREMFPSWSWAGWNFSGTYEGYTISFPTQHTVHREIAWYRCTGSEPSYRLIDNSALAYMDPVPTNAEHELSSRWKSEETAMPVLSPSAKCFNPQPLGILRFWTSTALLPVDRSGPQYKHLDKWADPTQENELMTIRNPQTNAPIGVINLHREWRAQQPDDLEFIILTRSCRERWKPRGWSQWTLPAHMQGLYIMLIEWKNNFAYRVQMPKYPVQEEDWVSVKPKWTLISLV
jgi:hypothetical protein